LLRFARKDKLHIINSVFARFGIQHGITSEYLATTPSVFTSKAKQSIITRSELWITPPKSTSDVDFGGDDRKRRFCIPAWKLDFQAGIFSKVKNKSPANAGLLFLPNFFEVLTFNI